MTAVAARPRTQHDYHHDAKVKPKAATAVIELLMMGGKTPETCWAVNKRQNNKLENCCIWLVIYLNCFLLFPTTFSDHIYTPLKSYHAVSSSFLLSVRLSACISTDPTGCIYVKLDMNLRMWLNSGKNIGHCTLRCSRWEQITIKALSCSEIVSGCEDIWGGINITQRATALLHAHCLSFSNYCHE